MKLLSLTVAFGVLSCTSAFSIEQRAACTAYTIIDSRGTGAPQGPAPEFRTMNANIFAQVPGGVQYSTIYPAGFFQDSSNATKDIIRRINEDLKSNPNRCFILEGYSQGAAAVINALPQITGTAYNAVKGIFVVGDPFHRSGLACNVDNFGGTTTRDVNGISSSQNGIPANWVAKALDVCIYGDGICDTKHSFGFTPQHGQYAGDSNTQNTGTKYVVGRLQAG